MSGLQNGVYDFVINTTNTDSDNPVFRVVIENSVVPTAVPEPTSTVKPDEPTAEPTATAKPEEPTPIPTATAKPEEPTPTPTATGTTTGSNGGDGTSTNGTSSNGTTTSDSQKSNQVKTADNTKVAGSAFMFAFALLDVVLAFFALHLKHRRDK